MKNLNLIKFELFVCVKYNEICHTTFVLSKKKCCSGTLFVLYSYLEFQKLFQQTHENMVCV